MRPIRGPQGALALRVDGGGEGALVLLVHADAGTSSQWDEVVALLGGEEGAPPVARLDLRGHGDSDPAADGDYGFAGRPDDLAAAVEAQGGGRVLLAAHSGGCGAALHLASRRPELVGGLLLVDPPSDPALLPAAMREEFVAELAGPDSLSYLQRYYRTIAGGDERVVERVLADAARTAAGARAGLGRALLTWNAALADGLEPPIRIITSDVVTGPGALRAERPDLPNADVHGTGHWVQIERPDTVVDELRLLRAGH